MKLIVAVIGAAITAVGAMLAAIVVSMFLLGEGIWPVGVIFVGVPLSVFAARHSFLATLRLYDTPAA